MTRIILRLNGNSVVTNLPNHSPVVANVAENTSSRMDNNGGSGSLLVHESQDGSGVKLHKKLLKTPPKKDKEITQCGFKTHQMGSTSDGDFPQWSQKKRLRREEDQRILPPPPSPSVAASRGSINSGAKLMRNVEDTNMGGSTRSPSPKKSNDLSRPILRSMSRKRSHFVAQNCDIKKVVLGGSIRTVNSTTSTPEVLVVAEAENLRKGGRQEVVEWPKIHMELSKKEKEEDFFRIKGTKLPLKPKKRIKAIQKAIEHCFPGMQLSDLTRKRYEVRERKNAKKQKQRGLKGMERMDTESD